MATVLLADDHTVVRQGLRALLEAETEFDIIGEAGSGLEALRMTDELKPDVLVLDIMMDDINGIEVTRQICVKSSKTSVVILSMYGDKKHVLEAMQAGAKSYIMKKSADTELVKAIREVILGRRYLGEAVSDVLVDAYLEKARSGPTDPYDRLSNREREVLQLAAHSNTNSEIAEKLCISRRTVETHRANGMRKLGLRTQTDLLRYALQKGILPPES